MRADLVKLAISTIDQMTNEELEAVLIHVKDKSDNFVVGRTEQYDIWYHTRGQDDAFKPTTKPAGIKRRKLPVYGTERIT